ncbi:hypothetical protein AB6735_06855 [Mucilaginibacter sp. RCC_168]|uniref:hypothetical protein n=1 Tax=Mucilaginibacter sp. RCC_168 TaxID=3239221 RepID=UPI003524AF0C
MHSTSETNTRYSTIQFRLWKLTDVLLSQFNDLYSFGVYPASFLNTIILSNGITVDTAEEQLNKGFADLVALGRSFYQHLIFMLNCCKKPSNHRRGFDEIR